MEKIDQNQGGKKFINLQLMKSGNAFLISEGRVFGAKYTCKKLMFYKKLSLSTLCLIALILPFYFMSRYATKTDAAAVDQPNLIVNKSIEMPKVLSEQAYEKVSLENKDLLSRTFLDQDIEQILGDEKDKYGLYALNIQTGKDFGYFEDKELPPASIYKVPLAVLILQDIDAGKFDLQKTLQLNPSNKAYSTDPLYQYPDYSIVSVESYLRFLIQDSDNTAMMVLEEFAGGKETVNERIRNTLKITSLYRDPMTSSPKNVGMFLKNLFQQKYLSKASYDFLASLMINTNPNFHDRIKKAYDTSNAEVMHKVGQLVNQNNEWVYNDAGVITVDGSSYIVVIMNKDIDIEKARQKIPELTRMLIKFFEYQ